MNNPKYTKYKDKAREYRFNIIGVNGEIIFTSKAFYGSNHCDIGIRTMRKIVTNESCFERFHSTKNKYYFELIALNGEVIGISSKYSSHKDREEAIVSMKCTAPFALVDDILFEMSCA